MGSTSNPAAVVERIVVWLQTRLASEPLTWLRSSLDAAATGPTAKLYLAFGMAGRKLGTAPLELSDPERAEAQTLRPGWNPAAWTVDQAARTALLCALPCQDHATWTEALDRLHAAASAEEAVALGQALPVLPRPEAHRDRATDLLRTNIVPVFLAVAHDNPYPAEQFPTPAFRQMVLKTIFLGQSLKPVVGLADRADEELTTMLLGLAAERQAAGRTVPDDLWRAVSLAPTESARVALRHAGFDHVGVERTDDHQPR